MRQMSVLDDSRRHVGSDVQVSQKATGRQEGAGSAVLAVPGTAERGAHPTFLDLEVSFV